MVFTISQMSENKSETKCVWKEFVFAVLVNLPFFTHGLETTTLTSSAHSGHFISYNESQWETAQWTTTAMVVTAGVSGPVFCYIVDKYGRMPGVFLISMVQGISLIPHFLLNSQNIFTIRIILHIIAGVASGGLFTILPIYIREVTNVRGFSLTLMVAMTTAGYLMKLVAIEVRLYVMVALVVVQFLSMLMMVESPSYLVKVKKYENAKRNLSKLTLSSENHPNISKELSNLKDESDRATANGNLSIRTLWRNKIWLDGTKVGIMLYTLTAICGSILFLDQQKALLQLRVNNDEENTLVISTLVAGSIVCLITSLFVDRKYLLFSSYIIMSISTGVLAVYTQADLTVFSLRWLPVTALGILLFGYGLAWGLPVIVISELLNFEIRATIIGGIYAYSQIIKLLHVHTFKYIEDYVGVYTTFYIFAGINLFGVVYTLFAVPNIRNKSLKQIEKQLKRPSLPA